MPPADASAQSQTPSGVTFVTGQEWRAPKLIGVGVYGPDDKQIGKIDDLMVDKNGATQTIVIGVGGFLAEANMRPAGSDDQMNKTTP